MIQDLHSHTYYSGCGTDKPEDMVERVISGGIELLGITDHQYGVGYGRNLVKYFDHINLVKEKYADKIEILRGVEICTFDDPSRALPSNVDVSFFDYCLIESLDLKGKTITNGDIFGFAERCGCVTGIAHTDMFAFLRREGYDEYKYFKEMADRNIFWEMNVNYDSIHGYREHEYVKKFFADKEQQAIVLESGVKISIGFDGHMLGDYRPERVAEGNTALDTLGIKKPFDRKK